MCIKENLPLIHLAAKPSPSTISNVQASLQRFGAFRLAAPQLTGDLSQRAPGFFQLPFEIKNETKGYSAFDTELILGRTAIPKESIYFLRKGGDDYIAPPLDLENSIKAFHDEWTSLRKELFSTVSMVLDSTEPLIGTPTLDYESVGLNFYDSDRLSPDRVHFNPAHKDSGTLTILVRSNESCDGLEIADLQSTEKLDSESIGREASFISVPAVAGEVIVLAGTRLQRLLGKSKVRACVHRVCRPLQASDKQQRLSLAIFCGPTMK
ncbi:hypothetical protein N7507_001709 [Penicillium longicatenatum]|nr:hypothetical protein N7507_001709 [Penicillium longicatenatum]